MYRCGIYLRTSKNVMEESNSIWMQEKIIDKYIEDCRDLRKIKVYIDEGVSGLTFARSGFINLMSDIEKQAINCVIVKDLSRLGRDYIQTGMYIQYIFPSKGVRLIAINDRYDSLNASEIDKYFMIPLRNYINDAYSRDISVKVRSSLYMKMKKGECVVSKVPFGYIKQGDKYVVVEEVRHIIERIFRYCLEGYSLQGISDRLNKDNIVTPYKYRCLVNDVYTTSFVDKCNKEKKYCWYPMMVKRILTDRVYIGVLVQGKVEKYSYKINKRNYKDETSWYYKYNHHEKIVEDKVFFVVSNMLKLDVRRRKNEKKCSEYSGIVRCGVCGKGMHYKLGKYICNQCNGRCNDCIMNNYGFGKKIRKEVLDCIIGLLINLIREVVRSTKLEPIQINRYMVVMNIKEVSVYEGLIGVVMYNE